MLTGQRYRESLQDGCVVYLDCDMTASLPAGGGMYAQRMVARHHHDMIVAAA